MTRGRLSPETVRAFREATGGRVGVISEPKPARAHVTSVTEEPTPNNVGIISAAYAASVLGILS